MIQNNFPWISPSGSGVLSPYYSSPPTNTLLRILSSNKMPLLSWLQKPLALLRLEGISELALGTTLYALYRPTSGRGWGFFLATLFLPDVFMIGYARSSSLGAITCRTSAVAVALISFGFPSLRDGCHYNRFFYARYDEIRGLCWILDNVAHTTTFPVALLLCGLLAPPSVPLLHDNKVGLITAGIVAWCHIAMDRMLGFGLKFPDAFEHTHLGWIKDGGKTMHWDVDGEIR